MLNVHNLDFGGVEFGSCKMLLVGGFNLKRMEYQLTHGDCSLVVGKLVMVSDGAFVGWY